MRSITIFMRYSDTILLYLAANVRRAKQKARHGAFMFSVHLEFFALSKCKVFIPYRPFTVIITHKRLIDNTIHYLLTIGNLFLAVISASGYEKEPLS